MKPRVLVSACLLGEPCRYDGKSKANDDVLKLSEKYELIPFCPEVAGGLDTPRIPCEIRDGKVIRQDGVDLTKEYESGAALCLKAYRNNRCIFAVLKERSPSCGCHCIYDGSFTGKLIQGQGVSAKLLLNEKIPVYSEENTYEIP